MRGVISISSQEDIENRIVQISNKKFSSTLIVAPREYVNIDM